jgi:predicted permease
MLQDFHRAFRSLARVPAFTTTSVLTLALGAGANAAILAIVYAILLNPLPYREPDRLVAVWPQRFQSNADLLYLRERAPMFASIAAVAPGWSMSLTGDGDPAKVTIARVSGNFFETLGATPLLGRPFAESAARRGADAVIVLSHELWARRYGSDAAIVGRTIQIDGAPMEVAAVMPRGFEIFGLKADAYTPFALDTGAWYHTLSFSLYVARLAPGVTADQADRDYKALIPQMRRDRGYLEDFGRTAHVKDLRATIVGDVRSSLVVLAAAVGLILLIAGVNIGVLQLTRASVRRRDFAVRAALGASRGRLVRESFAESVLLAFAGTVAGVAIAIAALPVLVNLLPANTPRAQEIAVSWQVGAAVLAAATLIALAVGVVPLFATGRMRFAPLLRSATSSESKSGKRTRRLLVASEIGIAVVLTIGAGLMLQSIRHLHRVDPGFDREGVLTMHLQPSGAKFRNLVVNEYYDRLAERLMAVPGVAAAGAIQHLPFSGFNWTVALDVEGHTTPAGGSPPIAGMRLVTHRYFEALGQPIVAGRGFDRADSGRTNAVIVNALLAVQYFGGPSAALGRTLRIRGGRFAPDWMTIVGVAGDVRHTSLTAAPAAEIYTPVGKSTMPAMMLAVRVQGDARALVPAVRDAIWSIERDVPISDIQLMSDRIANSLGQPRLLTTLLGAFAAVGLMLAAVGVYGVVAYSVAQRRRELGIMMALGAERWRIASGVVTEGLKYAGFGLAVGLPAALAGSRLLKTLVFGVEPADGPTYAILAGVVAAIVTAACAFPAYRATRIDPVTALRD